MTQIVKNGRTFENMNAYIQWLENREQELTSQLASQNNRTVTFKVAEESGSISTYGIQNQRPVSLYATQLERLIEAATGSPLTPEMPLGKFIADNSKLLAYKDDSTTVQAQKLIARKAESHGVVAHPKNANSATAGK